MDIVGKFKNNINILFKYNEYKVKDLVLDKIALFFIDFLSLI